MLEIKYKPGSEKDIDRDPREKETPENQETQGKMSEKEIVTEAPEKEAATEMPETSKEEEAQEENTTETEKEHPRRRRSKEIPMEAEGEKKKSAKKKSSILAEPVEKKPMKRWQKVMLVIGVIVIAMIMTFIFSIWREYARTKSTEGESVEVVIEQGSTTREVAQELKDAGVIRYETAFLLKIYFTNNRGKLRYGVFHLNDGMCLNDVIKALVTGGAQKEEESFTVPEGYSAAMIAEKLEDEGIMSQEEFLTAVTNAAEKFTYKDLLPPKDQVFYQLEGYLFPDTYYLSENMTGDQLVQKMLDEFLNKFDQERQDAAAALGMSVEEVLIRASLVQKETEKIEEYPTIAGVINNRLEQNMKLQFDSTVVYALSKGLYGVDRVLYSHLEVDSPYNTYKNPGLPVGPICNPSLEAIDGVLHPEDNDYLYFQADQVKNDGSNLYFKTYEEHEAAAATTENASSASTQTGGTEGQTDSTQATEQASSQEELTTQAVEQNGQGQ